MRSDARGVEEVALAIHAVLCTLHSLAALYHGRRRSWLKAGLHAAGAALDAMAMAEHYRAWRRT
jgi:predicted N-formylglutamate amidohydrolase